MAPSRRIAPIALVLIGCPACFNPDGDAATTDATTGTAGSTDPSTPTTSLADGTSGSTTAPPPDSSTDAGTSDTTTSGGICGNGTIEADEDCDSGPIMGVIGCGPDCKRTGRFVFLTDDVWHADEVGVDEGVALCNAAAPQPGAFAGLTYTVWLSAAGDPASGRIDESELPFIRLDGEVVAVDRASFIGEDHLAPIDLTPSGTQIGSNMEACVETAALAWTGTDANGQPTPDNCNDWSVADATLGFAGRVVESDYTWTYGCTPPCSSLARLYCVENP